MKKFIALISTVILSFALFFGGCATDGRDGKDADIYDIYAAVNEERVKVGLEELEFLDFIAEYLNYSESELQSLTSLQNTINRSLLSAVSVYTTFSYTSRQYVGGMFGGGYATVTEYAISGGSGVIIDLDKEEGDALVVTNCHVVYSYGSNETFSNNIRLYLYGQDIENINFVADTTNGQILNDENYCIPATIVGASISQDIAVLKVEDSQVLRRSNAVAASFCQDEKVAVGQTVYAVGNASLEGIAATKGIVNRDSENIYLNIKETSNDSDYLSYRVLRTDTAINGGNSGGGLFNAKGEIVGIVNAKTVDEDIDNMGYALPASTVKRVIKSLTDETTSLGTDGFKKAQLGITTVISDTYNVYNDKTGTTEIFETLKVKEINKGICKNQTGLKVDDILVGAAVGSGQNSSFVVRDQLQINRQYNLTDILYSVRKGDTFKLTVERDGENVDLYYVYDSNDYFITVA